MDTKPDQWEEWFNDTHTSEDEELELSETELLEMCYGEELT